MFDSNAFDRIYSSSKDLERIIACEEHEYYITSIQRMELENISDEKKKLALLSICKTVTQSTPTPAVLGFSKVGDCVVVGKDDVYLKLLTATRSNLKDAMIGTAAKMKACTVITDDVRFSKRLQKCHIPTKTYDEFISSILKE